MDNENKSVPVRGCLMCDSLYIKANGELPCWDDVGEDTILRVITEEELDRGAEAPLFDFSGLTRIRREFREGRDPFPDLCSKCAVRGHGRADSLSPRKMRVLHIEPTFLCQLACPQCLAPKVRLAVKKPPYYLNISFYEAILRQLKNEGVESIGLVHFEGRGDPLLHQELGEMVELTRSYFPDSLIKATTHGNYPYKPWMLGSGLDLLRLSVDGAFPESYEAYRVGGKLQKALDLMRDIRDARPETPSETRVEWKYILFEWNDSDDEIREAARLADELEVELRFTLTHSEGRSQRFTDMASLSEALAVLAPNAMQAVTFQMKGDADLDLDPLLGEHVEALLHEALKAYQAGDETNGRAETLKGLTRDPGLTNEEAEECGSDPVREHLERILAESRFPSTISLLANIQLARQDWHSAESLFREFLVRAPKANNRGNVEQTLIDLQVGNRLGCSLADAEHVEQSRIEAAIVDLLMVDPGFEKEQVQEGWTHLVPRVLTDHRYPKTLDMLGRLALLSHDLDNAEILFERYRAMLPAEEERVLPELQRIKERRASENGGNVLSFLHRWLARATSPASTSVNPER